MRSPLPAVLSRPEKDILVSVGVRPATGGAIQLFQTAVQLSCKVAASLKPSRGIKIRSSIGTVHQHNSLASLPFGDGRRSDPFAKRASPCRKFSSKCLRLLEEYFAFQATAQATRERGG